MTSYKKKHQTRQSGTGKPVDPAALVLLSHQVRNLLRFHQQMGIEHYPSTAGLRNFLVKHSGAPASHRPVHKTAAPAAPQDRQPVVPSLSAVYKEIVACKQCELAGQRSGQVPGRGGERPKLLVVGDWSGQEIFSDTTLFGRDEDVMLWKMMAAIGLAAEDVYVTNVIKCCPAVTPPDVSCARRCFAHLSREIGALKPNLILAMGEMAAGQLLANSAPLVRLRGRFHSYRYPDSAPAQVMPTFHPRFLLANPEMKKMVWMDLQMIQRQL
ncbi:MAG TPA: hypothetical protein ENI88_01590 [Desulfobulbus sp.]|nr:hypothetical protein [Desulfobulbus sp.]